jgi:hypothetical protein
MSVGVDIGLVLALLTAFGSVAGFLYKFRGAREAPPVQMRHPLRSSLALFRSPLYTLGIVIAMASWGLHVGALSLAPISLVQSVIAGGLVLLHGRRGPAVRDRGDPPGVDRRGDDRGRAGLPRRDARQGRTRG